jgi:hypothetical protein
LVSLVPWSLWSLGPSGPLVPLVPWSLWSLGPSGPLVPLVPWSLWSLSPSGPCVPLVLWSLWFLGPSGPLVPLVPWSLPPDRKVDVYLICLFELKFGINLCPRLNLFMDQLVGFNMVSHLWLLN